MFLAIGSVYHSSKTVKNSQKTVKIATITMGVLIVTCQRRVSRIHKAAQTPLPCETSITVMCLGSGDSPLPVIRVDCMCLHGRPCVWLPFAAACGYILFYQLMMPAARLSTTVIKFSIFSDPTHQLSALPPELRRIRYIAALG